MVFGMEVGKPIALGPFSWSIPIPGNPVKGTPLFLWTSFCLKFKRILKTHEFAPSRFAYFLWLVRVIVLQRPEWPFLPLSLAGLPGSMHQNLVQATSKDHRPAAMTDLNQERLFLYVCWIRHWLVLFVLLHSVSYLKMVGFIFTFPFHCLLCQQLVVAVPPCSVNLALDSFSQTWNNKSTRQGQNERKMKNNMRKEPFGKRQKKCYIKIDARAWPFVGLYILKPFYWFSFNNMFILVYWHKPWENTKRKDQILCDGSHLNLS